MSPDLNDRERRALRLKARAATLAAIRDLGGEAAREAIVRRALADAGFTQRELAAPPPAAAAVKFTRMVDYQLSWTLTNLKRDGLVENPVRGVWRLAGAALETPATAVEEPVYADRLDELQRMDYREYLRTPEWRKTRAAALLRADHRCSLDATHTTELEVHHRTYDRLGQELATDLVVLCRDCHRTFHKVNGRPGREHRGSAVGPASPSTGRPSEVAATALNGLARPRERRSLLRRLLAH